MKRICKILGEAVPRAMSGSRGARQGSLPYRLRANRGVKAMTVVAILSATLRLAGCGDNGTENGPKNKDTGTGDKIENPSDAGSQEKIFSNEVEFNPKNSEQAVDTAAFSLLKEAAEYLEEDKDFGRVTLEEMEENFRSREGGEDADYTMKGSQVLTSNEERLKKALKDEETNTGSKEPVVEIGLTAYPEEYTFDDEVSVTITKAGDESDVITTSFSASEDFKFPENKSQLRDMINQLNRGELYTLTSSGVIRETKGDNHKEYPEDWTQDPRAIAEDLELPPIGKERDSL